MDPAAPGRNEDERPALIYRNDPEVAKATAAALRAAVKYGMGSRKYKAVNRWKRARKGLLHKER